MEKLFTLLSITQSLHGKWVLSRLLSKIALAIGLILVTAIMCGMVVVTAFYTGYLALVQYGLMPSIAMLIVLGVMILCTIIIVMSTIMYLKRVREMPHRLIESKSPKIMTDVGEVVDAFIDGLLNPRG
jgi:hypothetical protein